MKGPKSNNIFTAVIFWGSLWGLAEATLGYFFHTVSFAVPGLPGIVMFPLAFYFMRRVFHETDRLSSVFLTAVVTAGIKLVDLFIPILPPIYTLNPALSIILESLAVILYFKVFHRERGTIKMTAIMATASAWRLAYVFIISLPLYLLIGDGIVKYGWLQVARFLTLDTLLSSIIIYLYLRVVKSRNEWTLSGSNLQPTTAAVVALVLAVSIEVLLVLL